MQLEELFGQCYKQGIQTIAMVGSGDVAEVALLVSQGFSVILELIALPSIDEFQRISQAKEYVKKLRGFDAILVTDIANPQATFDAFKKNV